MYCRFFSSRIALWYSCVCDWAFVESSHICKRHRFPLVHLSVGWFLLCAMARSRTHTFRRTLRARGCFACVLLWVSSWVQSSVNSEPRASVTRPNIEQVDTHAQNTVVRARYCWPFEVRHSGVANAVAIHLRINFLPARCRTHTFGCWVIFETQKIFV
jgi:hypothetical protein